MVAVSRLKLSCCHTNVFLYFTDVDRSNLSLVHDTFCKTVTIKWAFIFGATVTAIVILVLTFQQMSIVIRYCVFDVGHAGVTYFDSVSVEYFMVEYLILNILFDDRFRSLKHCVATNNF